MFSDGSAVALNQSAPTMAEKKPKPSPVEEAKAASNYLRGEIAQELIDGNPNFGKGSIQLLKHHGTYQQDDRDTRSKGAGPKGKSGKEFSFMVRTKIPGGRLSSEQLLAELDLCDEIGNATLRVTTRQALQLHGVLKGDLKRAIARINEVQLSTLGACGDVNRNVMCCPAPHYFDAVHEQLQQLAERLADHFAPRGGAYHELWLTDPATGEERLMSGGAAESLRAQIQSNGASHGSRNGVPTALSGEALPGAELSTLPLTPELADFEKGDAVEPIYGRRYLPRKFKMAVGLPGDNCVDLYAQDLGFLAVCRDWDIVGYNVLAGGGFGVTPSAEKTFPAVAERLCFVPPDQALAVAEAIVKVQRDHGNREDRKIARLKYVIHNWGLPKFKRVVEEYYGGSLADPWPDDVFGFDDHLGWRDQGDGRWCYGLNVENGRLKDEGAYRIKSAVRQLCSEFEPGIRLTSHQSILFTDVYAENRSAVEEILRRHGVPLSDEISTVRRWSMACPALPTCGLAITESERILPSLIDQLEVELARLGLSRETFTLRMTGCPNGCARPYNSDIGLVGKTAGKYTIFVGGRLLGDRLNFIYQDLVPEAEVVPALVPLFLFFKQERREGETFGDFCHRQGAERLRAFAEQSVPALSWAE